LTEPEGSDRWIAVLGGRRERTGGERRRRHIFRRLAERTGGDIVSGWSWESIRPAFGPDRLRIPWLDGARPRPRLVSGEMLDPDVLRQVERRADLVAVAIYDDPIPHFSAVGVELAPERARALRMKRDANVSAFRWQVMPTLALADLAGIPLERVIAGENGTDTEQVVPGRWPEEPAIAVTSGAAPGRGIETLIDAARLLRGEIPTLRLLLWLMPTGVEGEAYVATLHEQIRRERWIQMDAVATGDLSFAYRQATLFAIPHPPHPYWDATLPVKIFDALAAGRPLVITPRTETQRLVERHGVGVAASGDTAEELAHAMRPLLLDEAEARRMGGVAREVAETVYDWTKVGDRIATAILEREGIRPEPQQLLA
jgi:glycosyltransferase involved in cell wall biosynthesis